MNSLWPMVRPLNDEKSKKIKSTSRRKVPQQSSSRSKEEHGLPETPGELACLPGCLLRWPTSRSTSRVAGTLERRIQGAQRHPKKDPFPKGRLR